MEDLTKLNEEFDEFLYIQKVKERCLSFLLYLITPQNEEEKIQFAEQNLRWHYDFLKESSFAMEIQNFVLAMDEQLNNFGMQIDTMDDFKIKRKETEQPFSMVNPVGIEIGLAEWNGNYYCTIEWLEANKDRVSFYIASSELPGTQIKVVLK